MHNYYDETELDPIHKIPKEYILKYQNIFGDNAFKNLYIHIGEKYFFNFVNKILFSLDCFLRGGHVIAKIITSHSP